MIRTTILANILLCGALWGQSATPSSAPNGKAAAPAVSNGYAASRMPQRMSQYYGLIWGVESLSVKWVESGEILRFSFRVVDADKAKPLNDKKSEPVLIDPRAGVKLVIPSLEKVGQLRQTSTPEAGKSYWMAFSNKGGVVKRGDRVNVVIGNFRADGLVVN